RGARWKGAIRLGAELVLNSYIPLQGAFIAAEKDIDRLGDNIPALTVRMARGDERAFGEFYDFYFNRLFRYLLVVASGQEEIAREALQLTFVRVARNVRRFGSEAAFWNWLTVLARSSFTDEVRKRNRYQGLLARFFQERPAEIEVKCHHGGRSFEELLKDEMARLPIEERELLEEKYLHGGTVRKLAADWKMTEKAMESQLLRVRRKLKAAVLERLRNEQ